MFFFFFSSRRRHTRCGRDWSSDVCSSDLFRQTLDDHERTAVLPRLAGRPVLVCGGARDRLTPAVHSWRIAGAIPGAELVVYGGVGHMIPLERADDLTRRLAALVRAE